MISQIRPSVSIPQSGQQQLQFAGAVTSGAEALPQTAVELSFGTETANAVKARQQAQFDPSSLSFGKSDADDGAAIAELKKGFVRGNKVGISKMKALDNKVDTLLKDNEMRAALIDRYQLNSAENRKALMAVGTMESGSNGDMGETMTATLNRALVQNITREITGKPANVSIKDVVNQKNQYESAPRVNAVLNGGRTHQNWNAFKGEAGKLADKILDGEASFKQDASDIFFFRGGSFGRSTEFVIGKHSFDDTLNGQSYVQEGLRLARGINHNS